MKFQTARTKETALKSTGGKAPKAAHNVPVNSKTAHTPGANPGAFDFFKKIFGKFPAVLPV